MFYQETESLPKFIQRDQGRELLGQAQEWENEKNIIPEVSEVYRPSQNGGAESDVQVIQVDGKTHLSIGGVSAIWWVEACKWGCFVANLRSGAFLKIYGEAITRKVLQLMMPFGWRISFVKEQPQLRAHSNKENFVNKAVVGFFAGLTPECWVKCGYYENGKPKLAESTSVKRLSGFYFGENAPAGFSEVIFRGPHMKQNHAEANAPELDEKEIALATVENDEISASPVVFSCGLCHKTRYVEEGFIYDEDVRCSDYGRSCEEQVDPVPEGLEIFYGIVENDLTTEELEIAKQVYATISISNKEAWRKYPEQARKAVEKEKSKYMNAKAYDEEALDWRDVKKRVPNATYVMLAMIWTFAYVELGEDHAELKCRICGMGHQQRDSQGSIVAGIETDEHLWCMPPSTWQTRVFEVCQHLLGNELESEDFKAAFLQALLRGPPVYARVPIEFETEQGKEIISKGGVPVHRVRQAIYGLKRAGQDWQYHASSKFEARGFTSLRHLCDGSPSQFMRPVTVRPRSEGERKTAGLTLESGGGHNAGSGNGCFPRSVKITVKYETAKDPEVSATVEINDDVHQQFDPAVEDLSNRLEHTSIGTPKAQIIPRSSSVPKTPALPNSVHAAPKAIPEILCSKIVWDKELKRYRNCKHLATSAEGLCTLHYNLKYGEEKMSTD